MLLDFNQLAVGSEVEISTANRGTIAGSAVVASIPQILSDPTGGLRSGTIINSLCEQNLSFPEWVAVNNTRRFSHLATDTQLLDAVRLNPLANSAGVGEFRWQFVLPPNSNGAVFSIDIAEPASKNVTIGYYDTNMATVLTSLVCATTPGFKTFSLTFTTAQGAAPTPHLFAIFVQANVGGVQASPDVANASLVPTFAAGAGTGTFAAPLAFRRIALSQSFATHNGLSGVNSGLYPIVDSYCEYLLKTNARTCAVDAFNNGADGVIWTTLNGGPFQVGGGIGTVPNGSLGMQDFTIPAIVNNAMQTFGVASGFGSGPLTTATVGAGGVICAPRSLYVPLNSSYLLEPPPASGRVCVISGDSVTLGLLGGGNPRYVGWFQRFREWYQGEVINASYNSQGLLNFCGTATPPQDHPQLQLLYAQYLVREAGGNPTDIILDQGNNDYTNGTGVNGWTAAVYQQAMTGVVLNLLALCNARIWLKSMGITLSEGVANGAGSTPPQYAAVPAAVVAAVNDPRVIAIDGRGALFWIAGDLVDNVHPNALGQQKGGEAMIAAFLAQQAI